jgi:hypothetical protein
MESVQSQLITIEDLGEVQVEGYARHYSTVAEYYEAQTSSVENAASENIDGGREPYLMSRDAFDMGVHPLITVYDVDIDLQDGLVGISTARNLYWLAPETLLVWR